MKVSYKLSNKPNAKREVSILLTAYVRGERLFLSTGEVVNPNDWNPTKKEVKRSNPQYSQLNDFLKALASKAHELELSYKANGKEYNAQSLKADLLTYLKPEPKPELKEGLFSLLENYIEVQTTLKAPNTLKKFHTLKLHLQGFIESSKLEFKPENLNFSFYQSFVSYLVKQGLNNTSSGKYVAALKTFLLWCIDSELIPPLTLKKWKVNDSPNEVIALRKAEVMHLYTFDLSANERLSKVRDLFVFSCVTGLRFSDVQNLKQSNIQGEFLKLRAVKTGKADQSFIIPLNPISKTIIQKYEGDLPKISNQKVNAYLKELFTKAELTRAVQKVAYYGSKREETNAPLSELVSFHSGRKTFITVSLSEGVNRESVKQSANINNWKVMERYIAHDPEQAKAELGKVWGFSLKAV